jgi:hypothetical protein
VTQYLSRGISPFPFSRRHAKAGNTEKRKTKGEDRKVDTGHISRDVAGGGANMFPLGHNTSIRTVPEYTW